MVRLKVYGVGYYVKQIDKEGEIFGSNLARPVQLAAAATERDAVALVEKEESADFRVFVTHIVNVLDDVWVGPASESVEPKTPPHFERTATEVRRLHSNVLVDDSLVQS
jgi:hypothetical protein